MAAAACARQHPSPPAPQLRRCARVVAPPLCPRHVLPRHRRRPTSRLPPSPRQVSLLRLTWWWGTALPSWNRRLSPCRRIRPFSSPASSSTTASATSATPSKAAEPYLRLCGLDREDVLQRFLFVEGLYSYYQGSTAALRAASYLPLPYSALGVLLVVPPPLRDSVYDYVAKRRYDWFGKDEKCIIVQDKELIDRFIDRDELLSSDNNESS